MSCFFCFVNSYSIFCICSRTFSISVFKVIAQSVIDKSLAFDRIVLASRFISCAMKSSLRPTLPPSIRVALVLSIWLLSRTVSSSTHILSANIVTSVAILPSSMDVFFVLSIVILYSVSVHEPFQSQFSR